MSLPFVTERKFWEVAATRGGNQQNAKYTFNNWIAALEKAEVDTKEEALKFLAMSCWLTDGFRYIDAPNCKERQDVSGCRMITKRQWDKPGPCYHGRGLLMVTWYANYKTGFYELGLDPKRSLNDPDIISKNPVIASQFAGWYWRTIAGPNGEKSFKEILDTIDGIVEFEDSEFAEKQRRRIRHYEYIVKICS